MMYDELKKIEAELSNKRTYSAHIVKHAMASGLLTLEERNSLTLYLLRAVMQVCYAVKQAGRVLTKCWQQL